MPPYGIIPAKGQSFAQQFLPALIMGGMQGAQKRRRDEYNQKVLTDISAGKSPQEAMTPAPGPGGLLGILGNIIAPQPGISDLEPFTQTVLKTYMPSPKNALENAQANAVTKRVIPGAENYWIADVVTGKTTRTDIPVKGKGVFSDPITAGPDDPYADEGTTYQFGPENQMRVISKPVSPLDTQRIAESKTRQAAEATRAGASTKRVVPGDEYYFSVDTVTGETVQTKARVPVKDKGSFSDPVTAAEDDPYGVPAGTTYQFGPDNQMRTISKPQADKTDKGVFSDPVTATEGDPHGVPVGITYQLSPSNQVRIISKPQADKTQKGEIKFEGLKSAGDIANKVLGRTEGTFSTSYKNDPVTAYERYKQYLGYDNRSPGEVQQLDAVWDTAASGVPGYKGRQAGPTQSTGGQGTTRYQQIMRNPATGKSVGWDGSEWAPVVRIQMPDGSVWNVPADKADEAIKRGGKKL